VPRSADSTALRGASANSSSVTNSVDGYTRLLPPKAAFWRCVEKARRSGVAAALVVGSQVGFGVVETILITPRNGVTVSGFSVRS